MYRVKLVGVGGCEVVGGMVAGFVAAVRCALRSAVGLVPGARAEIEGGSGRWLVAVAPGRRYFRHV